MTNRLSAVDATRSACDVRAGVVSVNSGSVETNAQAGTPLAAVVSQTKPGNTAVQISLNRGTATASRVGAVVITGIRIVIQFRCGHNFFRFNCSLLTTLLADQSWSHTQEHRFRGFSRLSRPPAEMNWAAPLRQHPDQHKVSLVEDLCRCSWSCARNCKCHNEARFSFRTLLFCIRRSATVSIQP